MNLTVAGAHSQCCGSRLIDSFGCIIGVGCDKFKSIENHHEMTRGSSTEGCKTGMEKGVHRRT